MVCTMALLVLVVIIITTPLMVVSLCCSDYVITAEVETDPLFKNKTPIGYIIVLDDSRSYTYTDYKDIVAIENGAKFYKTYYYKKVKLDPDSKKFELIIKP